MLRKYFIKRSSLHYITMDFKEWFNSEENKIKITLRSNLKFNHANHFYLYLVFI